MKHNIRGENIEVTPALREYVEKKLTRVERYFDESFEAKVNMTVYNSVHKVEVTIPIPHLLLRAEDSKEDMYAAIDTVTDKLERQVRKHKTKINKKLREKGSIRFFAPEVTEVPEESVVEDDIVIVKTKQFDLKPMDAEEAVLQMNMLGHNFYIYTDAENDATSIVYARKDGKYGLIETK